ncbi:MAG TPA: tRNA dihydrouridine(16) synthase DusC, partial [Cellvibrionaceae bacterium]
ACPDLALQIKAHLHGTHYTPMCWAEVLDLLYGYYGISQHAYPSKYAGNRIKQWLMYLKLRYPEALAFFEAIKRERDPAALDNAFRAAGAGATKAA